jgi:hypothetical protein
MMNPRPLNRLGKVPYLRGKTVANEEQLVNRGHLLSMPVCEMRQLGGSDGELIQFNASEAY